MSNDYHDIKLAQNEDGYFDIAISDTGDFVAEDSFDTAIIISLFADARADESEVPEPERRSGFMGDLVLFENDDNVETGSRLWLVRGRRTRFELNKGIDYCQNALQWMVDNGNASGVEVTGDILQNGIQIDIDIIVEQNKVLKRSYKLFMNGQIEGLE